MLYDQNSMSKFLDHLCIFLIISITLVIGMIGYTSQVSAQVLSKSALANQNNTTINTNGVGAITGAIVNSMNNAMIYSFCGLNSPADCVLSNNTVTNSMLVNKSITINSIPCTLGSSCTIGAGGTSGQVQYNNGGILGGFTVSGDATLNTSTGNLSLATNAAANNLHWFYTPQQYDPTAGSGNDDSTAINACITAAITGGGGICFLPPPSSGHYNVCASSATVPGYAVGGDVTIEMSNGGGYDLRILPSCMSPPAAVLVDLPRTGGASETLATNSSTASGTTINFSSTSNVLVGQLAYDSTTLSAIPIASYVVSKTSTTVTLTNSVTSVGSGDNIVFMTPFDQGRARMRLENVRLDGQCVADDLHIYWDPGANATGSVFANAKAGGANILIYGGYENVFDSTNTARNINDASTGVNCYHYPSDLPAFNYETFGTDGTIGMSGVNAEIANFAQLNGGGNNFVASHGWGYIGPPYGDGQSNLGEAYGYYISGPGNLTSVRTDDPQVAWIRQTRQPGAGNVLPQPYAIVHAGSGGTPGYQILTGTGGTATTHKATYLVYVLPSGVPAGPAMPVYLGDYTVAPTFPDTLSGGGFTGDKPTVTAAMGSGPNYGAGSNIIGGSVAISGTASSSLVGFSLDDAVFNGQIVGANFNFLTTPSNCIIADGTAPGLYGTFTVFNMQANVDCSVTTQINLQSQISIVGSLGSLILGGTGNIGNVLGWSDSGTHYIVCGATVGVCNIQSNSVNVAQVNSNGLQIFSPLSTTNALIQTTAPTIASGFGTSPSVPSNNGPAAFTVNVGTGGSASSGVVTLPTATTGWSCNATDVTTKSTSVFLTKMTAETTTSATFTNYNTAGAATAWTASDILVINCLSY